MLFFSTFSALATLALGLSASAAPLPSGAAVERRFDLVKGIVRPGHGYVGTTTVQLASAPTQLPSNEAYFLLPDSLNIISPRAVDEASLAKRLTPFLLIRPDGVDDEGRLPEYVRLQAVEEDEAERLASTVA